MMYIRQRPFSGAVSFRGKIRDMFTEEERKSIAAELQLAEHARVEGNEGRARVCARRAAGIAIRVYFRANGISISSPNAYTLINQLQGMEHFPMPIRQSAARLSMRVDENFQLPEKVDLLSEARLLVELLEKEEK
jgi:hypothetical protein